MDHEQIENAVESFLKMPKKDQRVHLYNLIWDMQLVSADLDRVKELQQNTYSRMMQGARSVSGITILS